eukprot:2477975-Lingulodinium_polyedra.AAC.1
MVRGWLWPRRRCKVARRLASRTATECKCRVTALRKLIACRPLLAKVGRLANEPTMAWNSLSNLLLRFLPLNTGAPTLASEAHSTTGA